MPIHSIQATFAAGEFAPALRSRVDFQRYATGLAKARNGFIHPTGGFSNRAGTYFSGSTKTHGTKSRIIDFVFSTEQAYVIEFGEGYCRFFYQGGGQIVKAAPADWVTSTGYVVGDFAKNGDPSVTYYCVEAHTSGTFATDLAAGKWIVQSIYEIPTAYVEADLPYIRYRQSADVLYLFCAGKRPKKLTRTDHDAWTLEDYDFVGGPFMLSNADEAKTLQYTIQGVPERDVLKAVGFAPFVADHVGSYWELVYAILGQQTSKSFTAANQASSIIDCAHTWRLTTAGGWTGKISLYVSKDGQNYTLLRSFQSNGSDNYDTYGDTGYDQCRIQVRSSAISGGSWAGTSVVSLSADAFSFHAIFKVLQVISSTVVGVELPELMSVFSILDVTSDWSEGSWSEYRGWPAVAEFYQDRLVAARTPAEPQTGWATKTRLYEDFGRSIPLRDDDGISFNLPSQKVNAINVLASLGDLLALTNAADFSIFASNGILTPSTAQVRPQGNRGAAAIEPVRVGDRLICPMPRSQTLRDIGLADNSGGYIGANYAGADISIASKHFFEGYSIVEMAYQQEPNSLIWMVRDDGKLICLTYLREQEVLAFTLCETDGEVESICVIPGDTQDELWMIVKRTITVDAAPVTKRYVERMAQRMLSTEPEDQFFVDCGLTYDDVETDSLDGLDHLIGKEVAVLADGMKQAPKTVDADGEIEISPPASVIHVGLPYTAQLQTLNPEIPQRDGTAQGRKFKISEVVVRYLDSLGGTIGPIDESVKDNLIPEAAYDDEILEPPSALATGEVKRVLGSGFDDNGQFLIEQSDPLPLTILAVIPRVTVSG